jgi:hypothetical protein
MNIAPWVRCPECGHPIQIEDSQVIGYFSAKPVVCAKGHKVADWWKTACQEIEENFMLNQAFAFIGAQTIIFQIVLQQGKRTTYRFSEYGIPRVARNSLRKLHPARKTVSNRDARECANEKVLQ